MAGARGDFVNTWTSHFWLINYYVPVVYLDKSDIDSSTVHGGTFGTV